MLECFCPRCGRRIEIEPSLIGQVAHCSACAAPMRVPILGNAAVGMTAIVADDSIPMLAAALPAPAEANTDAIAGALYGSRLEQVVNDASATRECSHCGSRIDCWRRICPYCRNALYYGR